ncbi:ornithine cyclodeaminase family protein [Agromyces sp. NPDC058484]|uniref:ornithine cyclodeaminase family protein n=1 Tax=Agromyces sp. NPDC058484 TaxID=3346524 RepID=UPI00365D2C66
MPGIFDSLRLIDHQALADRVSMEQAVRALQSAVREGFDPDDDPPRAIVDVRHGQLLLMPADLGGHAGQKFATVAPGNPARGLERIQAIYVLLDAETLTPLALIDGTELTSIRTPAVSAAVADVVATPEASTLVVFGTGPQGIRHVEAMRAIRDIRRVRFVGRDAAKSQRAVEQASAADIDVAVGSEADVASADIIVCATTAQTPLFEPDLVADRATVIAIGSHDADRRELAGELLARSQVIVETERVARTEAGDVIMAIEEGLLSPDALVPMARIVTGAAATATDRPRVFKTCGMGWQDLAVARLAIDGPEAA